MQKKVYFKLFLASVIGAFLLNLFFGRLLTAKISTWPYLNRLNILSPQAPIVITNREEIRIEDGAELAGAVSVARSKMSLLLLKQGNKVVEKGAAVNLASEGVFVSTQNAFRDAGEYWVLLSDGRQAPVKNLTTDSATGLVFFKADFKDLPVAIFADSKAIKTGDKVLLFKPNIPQDTWSAWPDWVKSPQDLPLGQPVSADFVNKTFKLLNQHNLPEVYAIVSVKGEVAGFLSEGRVIPSAVIKNSSGLYLGSPEKLQRPNFSFSYIYISEAEAKILDLSPGAWVRGVERGSEFRIGDGILEASGQKILNSLTLEEVLEKAEKGSVLQFKILREGKEIKLDIQL